MSSVGSWDYLALTASNARQAQAYRDQLRARRDLGVLSAVRETLVVPDPEGRRIGRRGRGRNRAARPRSGDGGIPGGPCDRAG